MAEYKQMTLSECAKYDQQTNARGRLTMWGVVSRNRQILRISRKARRMAKKEKEQNDAAG